MSKLEDLADKILKSESHRSFATESWVRETISGLRWTAVQGAIYQDPREGKLREIDVLARRSWESSTAKKARVDVVLVIECKTMKGFHLLLAPASVGYLRFQTSQLASWLGYVYQEERPEITAALEKYGYGRGEVAEILKRIGKACYPRQYAKVGKFFIEPPPIATLFNAWKETNIGAEKDLDTSVFWRAVLALDSCVTSLRARRVQAFLEELEATVAAPETTPAKKLDSLDFVYRHYSERLWIYHPVVVTDARLWSSTTAGLNEVSKARFVQSDGIFETNRWFDLVSREHFDGYIRAVTAHYEKRFRAVRSTSVRI